MRDQAIIQLAEYGFGLTEDNRLVKGDNVLGAKVLFKKDRVRVETYPTGHKLFTGLDLGVFVAAFFCAKKVQP